MLQSEASLIAESFITLIVPGLNAVINNFLLILI